MKDRPPVADLGTVKTDYADLGAEARDGVATAHVTRTFHTHRMPDAGGGIGTSALRPPTEFKLGLKNRLRQIAVRNCVFGVAGGVQVHVDRRQQRPPDPHEVPKLLDGDGLH
jgi:hypothetical protein